MGIEQKLEFFDLLVKLGFKEIEISERVGISQSSVNTRAANAQWGLLNTAIKDFEALKIEQIS